MTPEPTAIVSDDGTTNQNLIIQRGQSVRTSILMMDGKTTAVGDADRDAAYTAYKKSLTDGWRSALTP